MSKLREPEFTSDWSKIPTCPYCGEQDQDWMDWYRVKIDGDQWKITCSECEKHYNAIMCVVAEFKTWSPEGEE